jgi:hypothetical protein
MVRIVLAGRGRRGTIRPAVPIPPALAGWTVTPQPAGRFDQWLTKPSPSRRRRR